MGAFNNAVITTKGQALLAKAILNTADLEFTKISISATTLTGDLTAKTGIGTVKQSAKVASVKRVDNSSVKVSASFTNESLTAGYYIRNIGLYAKDPDEGEILYSISVADESNATADWMPPYNKVGVSSIMVDLLTVVGNLDNVTFEVDPTAVATVAQITEVTKRLDVLDNAVTVTLARALPESMAGKLKFNHIYGKTEQVTTTGKNLIENIAETTTVNGVTFTVNEDKSITVVGTATEDFAELVIAGSYLSSDTLLEAGSYTISGTGLGNMNVVVTFGWEGGAIGSASSSDMTLTFGVHLTWIKLRVVGGKTVSFTYYPMVRLATETDATYEPYTGRAVAPSPEYPQNLVSIGTGGSIENKILGKNLLKNVATTRTLNGITFTVNDDGSVTVDGTATDTTYLTLCSYNNMGLRNGDYILSGCPSGGSTSTYYLHFYNYNNKAFVLRDLGSGVDIPFTAENGTYNIAIFIVSGTTVSDLTFYPMLRCAEIEDNTFEVYTKQSIVTSTPNGLLAIPVADERLATYTDDDGQMWCCDDVDIENGVYIQRIGKYTITADTPFVKSSLETGGYSHFYISRGSLKVSPQKSGEKSGLLCTALLAGNVGVSGVVNTCFVSGSYKDEIFVTLPADVADVDSAKELLTGVEIEYILAEPIETALTDDELLAYYALQSNDVATTVISDANIEVEYGTTKTGIHILDSLLIAKSNEIKINRLLATT